MGGVELELKKKNESGTSDGILLDNVDWWIEAARRLGGVACNF
jgi:hypothetical protein